MPATPTSRVRAVKQEYNTNDDSWGGELNEGALDMLDEAWGITLVTVSGSDVTLTVENYISDESRSFVLLCSGTGGAAVIAPAVEKPYYVINGCSSDITIKPSGGTAATVRAGTAAFVYFSGTTAYAVDPTLDKIKTAAADVGLGGFKLTGVGVGTASTDAATLSNRLDQFAAPTAAVSFGSQKITSLANGTLGSQDAAPVAQVESLIASATVNLPAQTGNGGRLLTTDGTTPSWSATFSGSFTWTGINTFTDGSLRLPANTTALPITDGDVVWDSDNDLLRIGTGSGRKTMVDTDSTQTLTNKTLTSPTISGGSVTGITDLAVADGGTGASDAAGARTNLEVEGLHKSTQRFTLSGTWTKPAGLKWVDVFVKGGGGGGGGSNAAASGAGGGGEGGWAIKRILAASLGATETVTIGAGGAGGGPGSSGLGGGTTSFGAHVSADGGNGGGPHVAPGGGFGGLGVGGDENWRGAGGMGGSSGSQLSGAGGGPGGHASSGSGTGNAGGAYGGGGAGSIGSGQTGGAGHAGICIVKEFF